MKKACLISSLLVVFGCLLAACSTSRNQAPSAIGIVPLPDYAMGNDHLIEDTTYRVIQNEADFVAAVNATSATAKKPFFDGQMVVALFMKTPSLLQFEKAEFIGRNVQIYLQTCSPSSQPACSASRVLLATIPKVGNARSVQFFINNQTKATVTL